MTLPAQSPPDVAEIEHPPTRTGRNRKAASGLTFLGVIGVSVVIVVLCALGGTVSGFFDLIGGEPAANQGAPSFVPTAQKPATNQFSDGQWVVGIDVIQGAYEATVPADSPGCTWEYASSADGTVNSVLGTGTAKGGEPVTVTLRENGHVVRSEGCGTWRLDAGH